MSDGRLPWVWHGSVRWTARSTVGQPSAKLAGKLAVWQSTALVLSENDDNQGQHQDDQ